MTIKELITHLKSYDEKIVVGVSGHFGEFHKMYAYDFRVAKCLQAEGGQILQIDTPYIGDEPS